MRNRLRNPAAAPIDPRLLPRPKAGNGIPYPFDRPEYRDDPEFIGRVFLPAWYTVTIMIGHLAGDNQRGSILLRPEDFLLYRITWSTNGDMPPILEPQEYGIAFGSAQGRCMEVSFKDEFTEFVTQPTLISALFGDSQGFLDIPQGLKLQGKQTLSVSLNRIGFPGLPSEGAPPQSRFDFCFQGVGLLRPGQSVSGSR